jgi:hypothetical protein
MTLSVYPIYEMATYFYAWNVASGGYNMVLFPIYEYGGAVSAAGQMWLHVVNITAEADEVIVCFILLVIKKVKFSCIGVPIGVS